MTKISISLIHPFLFKEYLQYCKSYSIMDNPTRSHTIKEVAIFPALKHIGRHIILCDTRHINNFIYICRRTAPPFVPSDGKREENK